MVVGDILETLLDIGGLVLGDTVVWDGAAVTLVVETLVARVLVVLGMGVTNLVEDMGTTNLVEIVIDGVGVINLVVEDMGVTNLVVEGLGVTNLVVEDLGVTNLVVETNLEIEGAGVINLVVVEGLVAGKLVVASD